MAILVVAVAPRAVRTTTVTTSRVAASVVPHVVAMTVVVSVVALAVVSLAVTTVVLLHVVKALAVLRVVMTVVVTVVLRRVVMVKAMAANLVLVTQAVAALRPVVMQVHRVVISLPASQRLPSQLVAAASRSWHTMPASALRAPRADRWQVCGASATPVAKAGTARCWPFLLLWGPWTKNTQSSSTIIAQGGICSVVFVIFRGRL